MTDLSSFGYADGLYTAKCKDCSKEYLGQKRSWRCKECAEKAMKEYIPRRQLSERQKEILTLYSEGKTFKEIADEVGISSMSVHNQMFSARMIMSAINSPHLLAICMRKGIVK